MALSMRRIVSVIAVAALMAAMLAAVSAPAVAQAEHVRTTGYVGEEKVPCEEKALFTPSGNTHFQCKIKSEGGNSGGSGGGRATTQEGEVDFRNKEREVVKARGHAVETPSGNVSLYGHYNPHKNA